MDVIDDNMRAAILRLTAGERECLKRCLDHQTAKEMALDLRVSPHAVEKRLKMARAKLGMSSSPEAAKLVAAADTSQRLVPQSINLPEIPATIKVEVPVATPRHATTSGERAPIYTWSRERSL
jgi:DNA-binding CsgD family transcriptional regulator